MFIRKYDIRKSYLTEICHFKKRRKMMFMNFCHLAFFVEIQKLTKLMLCYAHFSHLGIC